MCYLKMSEFFNYLPNPNNQFTPFSLNHLIPLILIAVGVYLIYYYRNKIANNSSEKTIRYSIAIIAILLEVAFQTWQVHHGVWDFADSLPLHMCRLTNYLGILAMLTKSYKIFEVAYFWSLGGVVSIIFPDIFHGPDRFRYYHFMAYHILFFYMYMYMLFVLNFKLTFRSFKKSYLILLTLVLLVIIPINNIFDVNYMFLLYPEETPFSVFEGRGYLLYLVGCFSLTTVIMVLWYLPIHFYNRRSNRL